MKLVWRSDDYSSYITPFSHDVDIYFVGFSSLSSSGQIPNFSYTLYETAVQETGSKFAINPSAQASHFTLTHALTSSDGTAAPTWISMTENTDDFVVSVSSSDS
jgi:hypothetical protein